MPDLGSADVTVTLLAGQPHNPRIAGTKKHALATVAFGDGAKTYPTNGVPMPSYTAFGFVRNLEDLEMIDTSGTALSVRWDRTNKTLRLFDAGAEVASPGVVAVPAQSYVVQARGW